MKKAFIRIFTIIVLLVSNMHTSPAQPPLLDWAKKMGGPSADFGRSVVVDATGNVYTTGYFSGTVDFDPSAGGTYNLTSTGGADIFIQKLDNSGNFLWAHRIGGNSTNYGYSIAIDNATNEICVAGYYWGTTDFNPHPMNSFPLTATPGSGDIFIVKLDANGEFVWAKTMGGASNDRATSIAIDNTGNIYATGDIYGTANFDPGVTNTTLTNISYADAFIVKLNAAGNFIWARNVSGTSDLFPQAICVDGSGRVTINGLFWGTADFNPGPGIYNLTVQAFSDAFILQLDGNGNFNWAKDIGGGGGEGAYGITADNNGNIISTGYFGFAINLDPGVSNYVLFSSGDDAFVLKQNSSGDFLWGKKLGGGSNDYGTSVQTDMSGNVYVSGTFQGTADLDGHNVTVYNLSSSGAQDIYAEKMDPLGNFIWAGKMGGALGDFSTSIDIDVGENVYLTGYFTGTSDFDPHPISTNNLFSSGSWDVFVLKLGTASPLPVELGSIHINCENQIVQIDWNTYSEVNNNYFIVEKSKDAIEWIEVNRVAGAGTTNTFNSYTITDHQWEGHIYYRLKQVDFDGTEHIYDPVTITCPLESRMKIYPNPTHGEVFLETGLSNHEVTIEVLSTDGKILRTEELINDGPIHFNIIGAPAIYFFKVYHQDKVDIFKIIKE